jgi:NarL family two-component system response regulator LiaR
MMSTLNPIRVMVVDEHDMVRKGLATCLRLNADFDLIGAARNGQEAVQLCEQLQPDVVLMDLIMPVMDGITATRIICQRWPQVKVIALTASQEQEMVRQALEAGAISYLLKNVNVAELEEAIRFAYAGQSTLAPEAEQALDQTTSDQPSSPTDA